MIETIYITIAYIVGIGVFISEVKKSIGDFSMTIIMSFAYGVFWPIWLLVFTWRYFAEKT